MDFLNVKFIKCNSCGGVTSMDGKDSVQIAQENAILKLRIDQLEKQLADNNSGESTYEHHLRHQNNRLENKLRQAMELIDWLDSNLEHFTCGVNDTFKSSSEIIEEFRERMKN